MNRYDRLVGIASLAVVCVSFLDFYGIAWFVYAAANPAASGTSANLWITAFAWLAAVLLSVSSATFWLRRRRRAARAPRPGQPGAPFPGPRRPDTDSPDQRQPGPRHPQPASVWPVPRRPAFREPAPDDGAPDGAASPGAGRLGAGAMEPGARRLSAALVVVALTLLLVPWFAALPGTRPALVVEPLDDELEVRYSVPGYYDLGAQYGLYVGIAALVVQLAAMLLARPVRPPGA